MSFGSAVASVFRQYATFTGRARRSEYWWFYLFVFVVSMGAFFVDLVVTLALGFSFFGFLVSLVLFLPQLAVTVRRLHDTGRSGWWVLAPAVPLVLLVPTAIMLAFSTDSGAAPSSVIGLFMMVLVLAVFAAGLALFIFMLLDSQPGPNRFGPSPKQPGGYPPQGGHAQPPYGPPHSQQGYYPPQAQPGSTYGLPQQYGQQ